MPIKIHHGAPGSYKTSGAIGDDFLREARAGRTIITNVRGVSRERTLAEFDDLPNTFDVIWIDDRTDEGREKLRKWFHWAPKGAFLFIDEAQDIWPRHWRDSDLSKLDYPGGYEKAKADDRPVDWAQAWDKHRHWNWDLVLTTPNIKKIRDDIRGVADGGYKHKDLALIGFGGRYVEGFHPPDDNGTSEGQFYSITRKKVPPYVWKLYDSTATGQFSATKSGTPLWKNPKFIFLVAILFGSLAFAVYNGGSLSLMPPALQPHAKTGQAAKVPVNASGARSVDGPVNVKNDRLGSDVAWLASRQPRVQGVPYSAPAYDEITKPKVAPEPVGCMTSKRTGCSCYTQQGTPYETTQAICQQILAHGLFVDWRDPKLESDQAVKRNDASAKRSDGALASVPAAASVPMEVSAVPAVGSAPSSVPQS